MSQKAEGRETGLGRLGEIREGHSRQWEQVPKSGAGSPW